MQTTPLDAGTKATPAHHYYTRTVGSALYLSLGRALDPRTAQTDRHTASPPRYEKTVHKQITAKWRHEKYFDKNFQLRLEVQPGDQVCTDSSPRRVHGPEGGAADPTTG